MASDGESDYRRLFRHTLIALAACATAVVFCYYKVDRSVAFFMHAHPPQLLEGFLQELVKPPPLVQTWSPLILALLVAWRAFAPYWKWQITLFVACVSLIVADEFRESLGLVSGRYWPLTWIQNNKSLIGDDSYGFHFFESVIGGSSFPSGHSARILGFATVWWIAMPRIRFLLILVCVPMLAALILLNYHFVSDVIAGSFLGAIVAVYSARLADLRPASTRARFDSPQT